MSMMYWKSGKIDRMCRSSPAAETRAAVDTEDELYLIRFQWSEMLGNVPDLTKPDDHVVLTKGMVVSDSKGVFEKCKQLVITPKGKEKRVDIEMMSFKLSVETSEVKVWWVHGDAQLANSPTKAVAAQPLLLLWTVLAPDLRREVPIRPEAEGSRHPCSGRRRRRQRLTWASVRRPSPRASTMCCSHAHIQRMT